MIFTKRWFNGTRVRGIGRINTDKLKKISENTLNPCHPCSIKSGTTVSTVKCGGTGFMSFTILCSL
jgi:hypothetical protein